MNRVRSAAVAGQFYAGESAQLQHTVDAMLAMAKSTAPCPKVLVAPHAGYIYSGPVAAEVYARLGNAAQPITRVVLLGPSHRVAFRGIATSSADFWETPLGRVALDRSALNSIKSLPGVCELDEAHALEHSLEVHLPFLQRSIAGFSLVPLVVGDAAATDVAAVIRSLWGGRETLIVISSDLSHYLPYEQAVTKDLATARLIESGATGLTGDQACGCRPLNGLLMLLRERGMTLERVDLRNSGDTAGDRNRVVGYGAWVANENPLAAQDVNGTNQQTVGTGSATTLNLAQRQQLLHLARYAIGHELTGQDKLEIPLNQFAGALQAARSSFVTLHRQGQLRGCIGSLVATRPLLIDVAHNARSAAFRDPRFKPLRSEELGDLELHISVLGEAKPIEVDSRQALVDFLQPGVHGVILQEGDRRATYLPSVWKQLPAPEQFVSQLRAKAGLEKDGWSADTRVSVYTTEEFC